AAAQDRVRQLAGRNRHFPRRGDRRVLGYELARLALGKAQRIGEAERAVGRRSARGGEEQPERRGGAPRAARMKPGETKHETSEDDTSQPGGNAAGRKGS